MKTEVRVLVSFLLFTALLSGCAKESIDSVSTYSSSTYSSPSNAEDTILANVFNADEDSYVYYYGSTDAIGNAQQVQSVSFNRQGSDTVYNFLLDENLRIEYMYSVISGVRDSKLQKLSYPTSDSIHYALYEYNWETQEDSLLYMAAVANTNGNYTAQTLYGKTEATAMLPNLSAIGFSFNVGVGVLVAASVGIAGFAFFSAPAWIAAAGSIAIATAWFGGSANASTDLQPGTVAPPCPSAGPNPNPSSTPINPSPCSGVNISMTAPVVTNVQLECNAQNNISILVSFTADGTGALIAAGYGSCDLSELCYPVRLYHLLDGGSEFLLSSNGYSASLISGNSNAGVIEITLTDNQNCIGGNSAAESLAANYPWIIQWKVELMNQCNQRSNQISF